MRRVKARLDMLIEINEQKMLSNEPNLRSKLDVALLVR
jgi:hypothetical protein